MLRKDIGGANGHRVTCDAEPIRVSPRTVGKYLRAGRRPRTPDPKQRWLTFVRNHARMIVACDFFVVVTATFRTLYAFVLMELGSRRIVHHNVTLTRRRNGPYNSSGKVSCAKTLFGLRTGVRKQFEQQTHLWRNIYLRSTGPTRQGEPLETESRDPVENRRNKPCGAQDSSRPEMPDKVNRETRGTGWLSRTPMIVFGVSQLHLLH